MIRAGLLAITVLAAGSLGCAQTVTVAPSIQLTDKDRQLNIDSFEYVWKTVRDKHWQAKPAGVDWQAIHDELRPAMEKASSKAAARAVLNDMLGRLHQTHFEIIPAELYSDLDNSHPKGEITTGIDVRVVNTQALVTSVQPDSSAGREGIQPGWQILKIGSIDLAPILKMLDETYSQSTLRELILQRTILSRLEGKPGDTISLEFLDGDNQHVSKTLTQAKPRGTLTQFGFLYPMHVWIDTAKLDGGSIGYVKFNIFLDPVHVMNLFAEAVQSSKACQGFIIDLRGNPGGIGAMAMGMAGWFIDKPDQRLGTLYMRDTELKFIVNPRPYTFAGPLAILVDGASASTSKSFRAD